MCKENRSTGKIVLVDCTKQTIRELPLNVQKAFESAGKFWPKVVMTDAAMSKVYAFYSYEQLKPQEYRSLFRDGRRCLAKDVDAGILPEPGKAAVAEADKDKDGGGFEPSGYEQWKSAQGSNIEARLVDVDDQGRYVFETRAGKRIPVAPEQLDPDSVARAKEIAKSE